MVNQPNGADDAQDIASVLTYYGFDMLPSRSGWFTVRCQFHGEKRPSARVSIESGAFICFACGIKGDAIGVIRQHEGIDYAGAVAIYKRITRGEAPGIRESVLEQPRGFGLLGVPRAYERGRHGFSRWLRKGTAER